MKPLLACFAACLALASCGVLGGGQGDNASTAAQALNMLRGGLFNRGGEAAPPQFTATRASLREAGITGPVLVARIETLGVSAGLLQYQEVRGATVWRSLDGDTITTAGGLLRNTRGFGTDLHSLETAPLSGALAAGGAEYARVFRGLDGLSQVETHRLYCRLEPQSRERVDVLGRGYDTQRYSETCHARDRSAPVFVNTYWQGADGTIWQSRQWAGPNLGYVELEEVRN